MLSIGEGQGAPTLLIVVIIHVAIINTHICNRRFVHRPCNGCGLEYHRSPNCTVVTVCYRGIPTRTRIFCPPGTLFSMLGKCCAWKYDDFLYDCGFTFGVEKHRTRKPSSERAPRTIPTVSKQVVITTSKPTDSTSVTTSAISSHFQVTCGIRPELFIVGGNFSPKGSWPWQVSIQKTYPYRQPKHACGGAVIANQWVITAAHCVTLARSRYRVVLNAYSLTLSDNMNDVYRGIIKIIPHPAYRNQDINYPNDIALLLLSDPVTISPICVPESNRHFTAKDECWIAGWGDTRGDTGRDSNQVLSQLQVHITKTSLCKRAWGADMILETHMCVGTGTTGVCLGDSGGPLMCHQGGRFYVAGVTSWGDGTCIRGGYPNIYVEIAHYIDWIRKTMSSNS